MSRITKWKLEKTKVKVVFRLQFHATHILQSGWDKLFISFIPADSGKATAKTTKANVRNGTCKWSDPIYETTRLLQDSKTKQYEEKLYKLVIAMGSSRSSILGEATINLADYADALKPSVVSLPLYNCDSGTTLHVTVQLLTSKTGFREFEQQRELRERGLLTDQSNPDESSGGKMFLSEDSINEPMDKVYSRVRSKGKSKDLAPHGEEVGPNEEYTDLAIGFDGSSNTSDSQNAERHDTSSTHELNSLKSTASGDLAVFSLSQGPQLEKGDPSDRRFSAQGSNDLVRSWTTDDSGGNDLEAIYEENSRLRGSMELAESSIIELKLEISSLQSYADEIGHEAQKFAQQLAAEIYSGEQLAKEVSALKLESSRLKVDLEHLKVTCSCLPLSGRVGNVVEQHYGLKDLQQRWLKGLSILEDNITKLQNKAYMGYHERDFRFLHSDLEGLLAILQNLKEETELAGINLGTSEASSLKEMTEMGLQKNGQFVTGAGFDLDMYQPELGMLHCLPGLVSHGQGPDSVDATNAMKGKIFELLRELDESKSERESLAKKMDQMECYYEALVQELEENQRQILGELQILKEEHSSCFYTVSSTKAEMEMMHKGLNEQILRLTEDKSNLMAFNEELERRAISAEAALKRARLNYSIAVDHLQKDLELLSSQVLSMFETSEGLVRQAFIDSTLPTFEDEQEIEHVHKLDSGGLRAANLSQLQNQFTGVKKQQLGGDIFLDDLKKSLHLQEGLYRKVDEEVCEVHFVNVHLDVLSKTLQETLLQADNAIKVMHHRVTELTWELELSTESKELLMQKLRSAEDDIHSLNECNSTFIAQCNDMAQQNKKLEANLQDLTHENFLLMQKLTEWEQLAMRCSHYESKYEACAAEKTELAYLLENRTLENGNLQNEIFTLQEELKNATAELDRFSSREKNVHNFLSSLQTKLQESLGYYERSLKEMPSFGESGIMDVRPLELTEMLIFLEKLQHDTCQRILKLTEDKKDLLHEKNIAQASVSILQSEIASMKQKYEHELKNTVERLNVSNNLVQKLHLNIEAISKKLQLTFEVEEKHLQRCNELFSNFDCLQVELQEMSSDEHIVARELLLLESVTNELARSNLTASELMKENQSLISSLQEKNEEIAELASELKTLKESLVSLRDENRALTTASLDSKELSSQLSSEINRLKDSLQSLHDENQALVAFSQQKSEEALKFASAMDHLTANLHANTEESTKLGSELDNLKKSLQSLHDENQDLLVSLLDKTQESRNLYSELTILKENFQSLHQENQALMASCLVKEEESAKIAAELGSLKESLQSVHNEKGDLMLKIEESAMLALELHNLKESMHNLHDEKQSLLVCFHEKSEESAKLELELKNVTEALQSIRDENQALVVSSRSKSEESEKIAAELNCLKEQFLSLHNELHEEKGLNERLEHKLGELTSELSAKESLLLQLQHIKSEIFYLKQLVSDLESEKSELCRHLMHSEECLKNAQEESSSISDLKSQMLEMHELLVAADIVLVLTKAQYGDGIEALVQKLYSIDRRLAEFHKKQIDVELAFNRCLATEAQYMKDNAGLLTNLKSLKSELEESVAENRLLVEENRVIRAELEDYKSWTQDVELTNCGEFRYSQGVETLMLNLVASEAEVDYLAVSNEELEVNNLILKAKIKEQQDHITLLEGCCHELVVLKRQCLELNDKLSEQTLKTEEFKNLSIHLKELKDKANAECNQAREKREPGGPPFAVQESLRIAFIKEQYETRLQELKQQLSISKKHSEEMLFKLQDAIDELESRKKSEASHMKKNDELEMKTLNLEAELQSVISDRREKVKAYDLMKAEMECSLVSLECCKEENQKLVASLQESCDEKSRIEAELSSVNELLEKAKAAMVSKGKGNEDLYEEEGASSHESISAFLHHKSPTGQTLDHGSTIPWSGLTGDTCTNYSERDRTTNIKESNNGGRYTLCNVGQAITLPNVQSEQDVLVPGGENELHNPSLVHEQKFVNGDVKHLALINDRFRVEGLRSSMDHLNNELERMKKENSLFLPDEQDFDQKFPDLQRELIHLKKANEELGSMFPLFNEFSSSGNALERVLALEMELAEALQAKKKSSVQFQSSFLKQHNDEEAIFKSFRDINELIKDMLEIKGRYAAMESELKDMHGRYSELSLQFAEVEGERQKLMMTLKNVRASKGSSLLNRSLSALPEGSL